MSKTTTPIAAVPDSAAQPIGTLEHLDPGVLELGDNVRDEAALTKDFVSNIAENGVLVPITGVQHPDNGGVVRVRNGQRRVLAARQIGLATVPVYVLPAAFADASEETVDRIVHQIVTNDQKVDLTDAQRARGIQQMIDAGMSITKVAKKLSVAKDTVKAADNAARSIVAMDALTNGQLSLVEAAAIAEFEDMPSAVERLLHHAGDRWFDHTLGQLREERASAQAQAEAAQQFRERGFTVLAEQPASYDEDRIPLRYLVTADGGEAGEAAVADPAHWAVLLVEDTVFVDAETGELVDETTIDWNTEDAPDAEPAEGMRHANTVKEAEAFVPEYYCTDYRAAGLTPEKFFARRAGIVDVDTDSADEEPADQEARDAQRETARLKAEADKEEAEKRERRKVLALNKLGLAAEGVRREFVKTLLQRKTPPKGAAIFVADCLARDSYLLTTNNANATTAELLGVDHRPDVVSKLAGELSANSGDGRAQVLTLALVLGALEAKTPKDSWRNPAGAGYWGHRVTSADYLRWLAENGYTLAPIEEVVTGAKKADKVFSQYLADAKS